MISRYFDEKNNLIEEVDGQKRIVHICDLKAKADEDNETNFLRFSTDGKEYEWMLFDENLTFPKSEFENIIEWEYIDPFPDKRFDEYRDIFMGITIRTLFEVHNEKIYEILRKKLFNHLLHISDESEYLKLLPYIELRKTFISMSGIEHCMIGYKLYRQFELEICHEQGVEGNDKDFGFYVIKSKLLGEFDEK